MPQEVAILLDRPTNLKRFRKNLKHEQSCWMCEGFNKRKDGRLVNHEQAGFDDWLTGRHSHTEGTITGLSIEGTARFQGMGS